MRLDYNSHGSKLWMWSHLTFKYDFWIIEVLVSDDLIHQEKGKRAVLSPKAIGQEASILLPSSKHKCNHKLELNEKTFSRMKSFISDAFLKFASPLMIKENVFTNAFSSRINIVESLKGTNDINRNNLYNYCFNTY